MTELRTTRLLLRQWKPSDREPFATLNADPVVMEHFPRTCPRAESDAFADRCERWIREQGWGFWAVERVDGGEFLGFVGLHRPTAELPFSPCVEIGWRLAQPYWGHGYATEAARAALRFGFESLGLHEVVSFTATRNQRSRAVMVRLGMKEEPETFEHPLVPEGHPVREHCLYRLSRQRWRTQGP